jgi:hypothetical protein
VPLIRRNKIDTLIEEKILTGMIVSDSFCRDIIPFVEPKGIIETPYIETGIRWCQEYYLKYKKAPSGHITDIYEIEKENLKEEDQISISKILVKISEQYEEGSFNEDFIKDRAISYINSRAISNAANHAIVLLQSGKVDEAEETIQNYRKVSVETCGWEDPFAPDTIRNHFADEQLKKSHLFAMPGPLGMFLGPFERNWLVGVLAPAKRGKTFWLMEMGLQALFSKKKVVFISLEMNSQRVKRRMYKRLTAQSSETKEYIYPVFDCKKNQENICNKSCRQNSIRLLDSEGQKPQYSAEMEYRPCSACMGKNEFEPETWFTTRTIQKMKNKKAIKLLDAQAAHFGYSKNFGSNFRLLTYPAFSANLKRVRGDINKIIDIQEFVPDVILIDYADILAPEDSRVTGRDRIDETWKSLKRMSDELHCMVGSASQSNRGSFDKKNVTQTDTAEDIRKIANSDLFLAINQTPQEKRESRQRIAKIASRDEGFDQYEGCIVLQQLALGQVCLESYFDKATAFSESFLFEDFCI